MEWHMYVFLLFSGLCSLSSCVPQHLYFLVNTPKTWHEARKYCREKCFDLATIDDMGEMETALQVVEGEYVNVAWIGLQKTKSEKWHWSLANKNLYKEGERNYLIWGNKLNYNCGAYNSGKLYRHMCGSLRYSVCFDGTKHGHEQYVYSAKKMTWIAARDNCRKHYTDLASVRNKTESQMIQEVVGTRKVWVGLFQDSWKWSDNTYSSFRYWKSGKAVMTVGKNRCGALVKDQSGRWGEPLCRNAFPFLCNCPIVRVIRIKVSAQDPKMDLNDPGVHGDILKQIKQELNKTSVTDVFQLRWKKHPDGRVFIKESNQHG